MSSYQNIKNIYCQQEKIKSSYFLVYFDKYCMYKQFTSYIFSALLILLSCIVFFIRKASSNKNHYFAIFVQSLSVYTPTDRLEWTNCCKWYHIVCCQGIPKKCLDDSIVPSLAMFIYKKKDCYLYVKSLQFL